MAENGEKLIGLHPRVAALVTGSHTAGEVRRCGRCGVRKVLEVGFYRDRTCRGGRRPECKRCQGNYRRAWARRRRAESGGKTWTELDAAGRAKAARN